MSKTKELIKNTGIIAIGKFSTKVVSFFLLPLYTALLSTSEYGEFDFLVIVAQFLTPFITLLMDEGMFRFLIDADNDQKKKEVISQAIIYITFSISIFSLIVYAILRFVDYKYSNYLILYIISLVIFNLALSLTRGLGKIKLYSFASFLSGLLHICLNILFIVFLRLKVEGLLLGNIISNLLVSLGVLVSVKIYRYISFKDYDSELMREMLHYTFPLVPNSVSWTIINFSDRMVLTSFLGTAANGIYSVANKFPTLIDTIYGFFYTSWKESASKAIRESNSQGFYSFIYMALNKFLMSITIGLIAVLPLIFNIFISESYNEAYQYIPFLILSMFFANMSGFYGGIFSAYKNTKIMGITTIISAIINFGVCIILVKPLGIYAGVLSTLISNFIVYIYRRIKIKEYIKLPKDTGFFIVSMIVYSIIYYCYYSQNLVIKLIGLGVAIIYALLMNKNLIISILKKIICRRNEKIWTTLSDNKK